MTLERLLFGRRLREPEGSRTVDPHESVKTYPSPPPMYLTYLGNP